MFQSSSGGAGACRDVIYLFTVTYSPSASAGQGVSPHSQMIRFETITRTARVNSARCRFLGIPNTLVGTVEFRSD